MRITTTGTTIKNHSMGAKAGRIVLLLIAAAFLLSCATGHDQQQMKMHMNMGIAYMKSKNFNSALKEFMAAERISSDNAELHYYIGACFYTKRLLNEAAREFQRAIELKKNYSEAHNYLGTVYLEMERYDLAIGEFEQALSNVVYETPSLALNNMGWAYYKKGDMKNALKQYHMAITREPESIILPLIYNNMGRAYLEHNDVDQAISAFEDALDAAPTLIEPRYWLGISYVRKGDAQRAVRELRAVVSANAESEMGMNAAEHLRILTGKN